MLRDAAHSLWAEPRVPDAPGRVWRDWALVSALVPVVVAPGGLTLGGGCEICLHGTRVQASAETYMGLVEAGELTEEEAARLDNVSASILE